MTEIIMIMGFLGSGKTTLLEHILKDETKRVGVVVNEFGSVSVDGERLKNNRDIDIMEVNSGSIFCACKSDFFIKSILSLIDMGINKIYVESSGLSNPSSIAKIMEDLNSLKKTKEDISIKSFVCVTDAERIAALLKASVAAVSQVQRSNIILLNKIDNVGKEKKLEAIQAIKEHNSKAEIIPCVMCDVDMDRITALSDLNSELECIDPKPISERSFTILCEKSLDKKAFREFINTMLPLSVRIKGFVTIEKKKNYVDIVPPYISIKDCTEDKPDELVIIVFEDAKETAKRKIENTWKKVFGEKSPKIVV